MNWFWYWPVDVRKIMFEMAFRTKKVDGNRPKGCVWNRYKVKQRPWHYEKIRG